MLVETIIVHFLAEVLQLSVITPTHISIKRRRKGPLFGLVRLLIGFGGEEALGCVPLLLWLNPSTKQVIPPLPLFHRLILLFFVLMLLELN